ncbi:MAG: hypothetical protein KDD92_19795, partial [Caldilineaceae bacterium]|nr:hypothetical protein [Caldilineaceae bacterium]
YLFAVKSYLFWNDPLNAANVVDSTHVDSYLIHPSEKVLYKGGSLNPIIAHGDYENSPYLQQTNVPFDVGTGHTLPTIGYDAPQEPISAVILGDIDRALGGDGIL